MRNVLDIILTLFSIILSAAFIITIFIFMNQESGTLIFIVGIIILLILIIYTILGIVREGVLKVFRLKSRFKLLLVLIHLICTILILFVVWLLNYALYETGENFTAKMKVNLITEINDLEGKNQKEFIKNYPVLEYKHIRFIYHPDTENTVNEIINSIKDINEIEKEIFGDYITKTKNLDVIVLRNSKDFIRLNPSFSETVAGSYDSTNNTAMIYQERENFNDDEFFMIGTFTHEYIHYLLDLFLTENDLNDNEIPFWYKEGICEYVSKRIVNTLQIRDEIDYNVNFTDLHTSEEWITVSETTDVYYLARTAIEYIVGHQGDIKSLSEILLDQRETGSFEESFNSITELNLNTLNTTIFSVNEDLQEAWFTWQERDFETAEKRYKEIIEKHPNESIVWHQFALMLEEQKRWDAALDARRRVVNLTPDDAAAYQYLSYLLTISDTKEAMEMAAISLELTKKDSNGNVDFVQIWVDEISMYHNLISIERHVEAYRVIFQSEQLANMITIMEELKKQAKEKSPDEGE